MLLVCDLNDGLISCDVSGCLIPLYRLSCVSEDGESRAFSQDERLL